MPIDTKDYKINISEYKWSEDVTEGVTEVKGWSEAMKGWSD